MKEQLIECPECKGKGKVMLYLGLNKGRKYIKEEECLLCKGKGKILEIEYKGDNDE